MTDLFPPNPEYSRFTRFKTPFNSAGMRLSLNLVRIFLVLSLPCFLLIYVRKLIRRDRTYKPKYIFIWPVLFTMNLGLAYYVYNLLSNKAIFYFDRPYTEDGRAL